MPLNGTTIQKGDSFTLALNLQFTLTATLTSGSAVLTNIKAGFFSLLNEGVGWTIAGDGVPVSTAIVDVCEERLEVTLSNPATLTATAAVLTLTTGSFTGKTLTFTVFKTGTDTPALITKTSTGLTPGIVVDTPTTARVFLAPTDTNSLVIPKPRKPGAVPLLPLDYFIKASHGNEVDTISAGTFNLAAIKTTPLLPPC